MKITVPVTVSVEIDFDMTEEEAASYRGRELENLTHKAKQAVAECLHQNAGTGLADDMVEFVTDETGWCVSGLYMEVK